MWPRAVQRWKKKERKKYQDFTPKSRFKGRHGALFSWAFRSVRRRPARSVCPEIRFPAGAAPHSSLESLGLDLLALSPLTGKIRGLKSFMNYPWGRKWPIMRNKLNSLGNKKRLSPMWWFDLVWQIWFQERHRGEKSRVNHPRVRHLQHDRGRSYWLGRRETASVWHFTASAVVFSLISNV